MSVQVTHHRIVNDHLDYSSPPIVLEVPDDRAAMDYFAKAVQPNVAAIFRQEVLLARKRLGLATDSDNCETLPLAPTLQLKRPCITFPWTLSSMRISISMVTVLL